jgi:hypothetical protein
MNLDVVNSSTTTPKRLVFNMTRTIPFLSNAEDYFLTVARFNLQTSNSLPVFIPDIQTGQNDPNLTTYEITFYATYNAVTSLRTTKVYYLNTDTSQPTPSPPLQTVDKSSSYYWVENVYDWVLMLNLTLTSAALDLNRDLGTTITTPYIQYDLTTGLFTLYMDQDAVANKSFQIYFNPALYNILPFPSIYKTVTSSTSGVYLYLINVINSLGNQSTNLSNGVKVNFISSTTEFSPLSLMCPIRSIYFATNLLPIEPLLTTPPKVLTDSTLSGSNSGDPGITNILTDFQITVTPQNNYNGEVSYLPSAEYRWIDLTQGVNLNKLDISAFWKDKLGNSYPIYLPVGCSANIKLLFRNRKYNLGYY